VQVLWFFAAKNSILGLKKAATNIGLAKNRRTEFLSALVSLSCFGSSRIAEIWPVKEVSTFDYKFNFGFG